MTLKNKATIMSIPALAAIMILGTIAPSFANGEVICDSPIENTTVNANVVVPQGESCDIRNSTINGNIESNGILFLDHAVINGNITSFGYVLFEFQNTINGNFSHDGSGFIGQLESGIKTVLGNVEIKNSNSVSLINFHTGKNLILDGNTSAGIVNFSVGKNLVVNDNDTVGIANGLINGKAICSNNDTLSGSNNNYGKNDGCP